MSTSAFRPDEPPSTDRTSAPMPAAPAAGASVSPSDPAPDQNLSDPEPSACPTPLSWTDVVAEFRSGSEPFEVCRDGRRRVSGRTWGDGPPIYFLNGIMGSAEIFCLTIWLLREDFRCIVLDYDEDAAGIDDLAETLMLAADELGHDRFDVFATSFGTTVALQALLNNVDRIRRAILQGPLVGLRLTWLERCLATVLRSTPGRMRHVPLFRHVLQRNHRLWYPPIDWTRWEFQLSNAGATPVSSVARRARMLHGAAFSEHCQTISAPTLIITSEGEAQRHKDAGHKLHERLPKATIEQIPNSGHVPYVTHPHRLVKLIRTFLLEAPDASC